MLWPDGFWCFSDEHVTEFGRGDDYRVIASNDPERLIYTEKRVPPAAFS
jgi:hypothetical protein